MAGEDRGDGVPVRWTQKELEDIFVRGDIYKVQRLEFEKDLNELKSTLTWATRLVVGQAALFFVAIGIFIVERLAA